ncbi:multidrug efflux MFS transporter EmrD [Salinivibrio kushneri]|uniref:Multidrug transporter EmrD n=1 Tax=Salinivibrio kushneri TaxID=1908198 RepID=A0AB36K848_9GAMM|nr:multidrug efflux MFS transporter EmrD [Salinivibrio kushneri]OOE44720.1 multidrug transporter EmrD [Salinivibrio kushneri]OOE53863.1 multidrug transporter EmrD [Salinivibrio kushneri]WBA12802.1 multidrug efflux MFS transporter EmrD [Salinivibrio kushneri]
MSSAMPMGKLLLLIVLLAAVGQMTQTMYVPSIGAMADDFAVSPAWLQAVMACYLIPYGLSQFVYGPVSDRIGRKPVILFGLALFLVGTAITLLATSFAIFLLGSIVQGAGIGCGGAMARTLTRDCFAGAKLHRANSLVSMGLIFSPLVAPLLGGFLTEALHWRASYFFLLLLAVLVYTIMAWRFSETLPADLRQPGHFGARYRHVMRSRQFKGYLLCLITVFSGVSLFEAAAGVIMSDALGLSPSVISLLFVVPLPAYLVGSGLSSRLSESMGYYPTLTLGGVLALLGAGVIGLPGMLGDVSLYALVGGGCVYFAGAGILFPAASTGAINPFPHHAGTAGAILGGAQNLLAGLVTLAASSLGVASQLSLGIIMLTLATLASLGLVISYRAQAHDDADSVTVL